MKANNTKHNKQQNYYQNQQALSYLTLEILDMNKICNDGLGIIEFL